MTSEARRPPGRPRSEASRQAILGTAAALLAEVGYAGMTIDEIAARARVGKQTIYRWWPTKADVVLEASAAETRLAVPTPDRGGYAADLRAFLLAGYRMANDPATADFLRALMVEAQTRPEFGERFRRLFLEPRREAFGVILSRAARRGDLPARPAPETVAEIIFGTLWYRLLATRQDLDERLADDLVHTLCPDG